MGTSNVKTKYRAETQQDLDMLITSVKRDGYIYLVLKKNFLDPLIVDSGLADELMIESLNAKMASISVGESAKVSCLNFKTVIAHGAAQINCFQPDEIPGLHANIFLYDQSSAYAYASQTLHLKNKSTAVLFNQSVCRAEDDSTVMAYRNSVVYAFDRSKVFAYGHAEVYLFGNAAVFQHGNRVKIHRAPEPPLGYQGRPR